MNRYKLVKYLYFLSFIGIVIHEYAHKKACDLSGIYVSEVKYFQLGSPNGFVKHDQPLDVHKSLFISISPLILNTLISVLVLVMGVRIFHTYLASSPTQTPLIYVVIELLFLSWLGVSLSVHAFPSTQDSKNVYELVKVNKLNPVSWVSFPIVMFLLIGNKVRAWGVIYPVLVAAFSIYLYRVLIGFKMIPNI